MNIPEGLEEALMAEMDRRFKIAGEKGRLHDEALAIDDTQLGVEFAIDFVKAMLAAAPTPPAQEAEPGGYIDKHGNFWSVDRAEAEYSDGNILELQAVYTHPDTSELRKAAEELVEHFASIQLPPDCTAFVRVQNLRAALGKK